MGSHRQFKSKTIAPARDPQGQFHIWVWLGGVFYAMVLALSTAILSTWLLLRTAGKDGVDA